jgi:hypothetical protein
MKSSIIFLDATPLGEKDNSLSSFANNFPEKQGALKTELKSQFRRKVQSVEPDHQVKKEIDNFYLFLCNVIAELKIQNKREEMLSDQVSLSRWYLVHNVCRS